MSDYTDAPQIFERIHEIFEEMKKYRIIVDSKKELYSTIQSLKSIDAAISDYELVDQDSTIPISDRNRLLNHFFVRIKENFSWAKDKLDSLVSK